MVSDIHLGKLKGHSRPLVDTKFIGNSPFNMTVDQENEIRIWDIRSFSCLQVIRSKVQTAVQGLLCIEGNIMWVYGKRFIQFDTYSIDEDGNGGAYSGEIASNANRGGGQKKTDNYPLFA